MNAMALSLTEWLTLAGLLIQVAGFIGLIVYVVKTANIAKANQLSAEASVQTLQQMQEVRLQETAPAVIVYFDIPYGSTNIFLMVENVGRSPAIDVRLKFDPPLSSSMDNESGYKIANLPAFASGIPTLPPGYKMKFLFDHTLPRFSGEIPEAARLPMRYEASVSFRRSDASVEYAGTYTLDLAVFGEIYTREKGIGDVARAIEDVAKAQRDAGNQVKDVLAELVAATVARRGRLSLTEALAHPAPAQFAEALLRETELLMQSSEVKNSTGLSGIPWNLLRARLRGLIDDLSLIASVRLTEGEHAKLRDFIILTQSSIHDPLIRYYPRRQRSEWEAMKSACKSALDEIQGRSGEATPDTAASSRATSSGEGPFV